MDTVVIEQAGGYKVTVSATCSADLIISREGSTVAFLLLASSSDLADPRAEAWDRHALSCLPAFRGSAVGRSLMQKKLCAGLASTAAHLKRASCWSG